MTYMTKAQFITGMRLVFGSQLLSFDSLLGKLFASFDPRRRDQMDWRSFLFLLAAVMQPDLLGEDLLRYVNLHTNTILLNTIVILLFTQIGICIVLLARQSRSNLC
jgi:hypothetical protein